MLTNTKRSRVADAASPADAWKLTAVLLFLAVIFLAGGASRADALSQPVVRLASAGMIGLALVFGRRGTLFRSAPFLLLCLLALLMLVQLVPLPPGLWRDMPGHGFYVQGLELVGLADVWRPLSLTPDRTLNSLLALLPFAGVLAATTLIRRDQHGFLVWAVLAGAGVSALLGLAQVSGAMPSLYQITNRGAAVGLFANRNHNAALMVCALPLIASWVAADLRRQRGNASLWIASAAAVVVLLLVLVGGSRTALLLLLPVGLASVWLVRTAGTFAPMRGKQLIGAVAVLVALVALVGVVVLYGRGASVDRLTEGLGPEEVRTRFLPVFWDMALQFFPFGSGFGSFDPVFRTFEPVRGLASAYVNHAHNDAIELLIEGGVAAVLLFAAFVLWALRGSYVAWRGERRATTQRARAASIVLLTLLIWSFVDYPLRTPTLIVLAGLCLMLLQARLEDSNQRLASEDRLGNRGR